MNVGNMLLIFFQQSQTKKITAKQKKACLGQVNSRGELLLSNNALVRWNVGMSNNLRNSSRRTFLSKCWRLLPCSSCITTVDL